MIAGCRDHRGPCLAALLALALTGCGESLESTDSAEVQIRDSADITARPPPGDAVASLSAKGIGDGGRILMASVVSSNAPLDYRAFGKGEMDVQSVAVYELVGW